MEEALLPAEAVQTVDDIHRALRKVEEGLGSVLPKCTRESFEQLSLVERASTFATLSKTLAVLFGVYLKTNGVSPDEHPANSELVRVGLYQDKVQKAVDRSRGPQLPTSSLDVRATNRFIERAIPDLSEEQRKGLRELGKKKGSAKRRQERGTVNSTPKKRPSGMTLAEEAAAFLAEATKESSIAQPDLEATTVVRTINCEIC